VILNDTRNLADETPPQAFIVWGGSIVIIEKFVLSNALLFVIITGRQHNLPATKS
jgi:hypothetical protein